MKILIIEDNRSLAKSLKDSLSKDYAINVKYNGKKGIFAALTNEYDLIILDLQLPDINGLEICKNLREEEITIPILILSGKSTTESKTVLLNAGADDYLTKPFYISELKARIKSLLRRSKKHVYQDRLSIGSLLINVDTKTVMFDNHLIKLSKKEFMLLHYLLKNPDIPISRFRLFEHIWEDYLGFNSNTVDVHICNLRNKLKMVAAQQVIKTIHGNGYMLESHALIKIP